MIPALALPPPPTTNTRAVETPVGTSQTQLPLSEKVNTVSLPTVVEVGIHAAAFAGTGIETKRLVTKTVERTNAIFFTRPKIGSPISREPK